MDSLSYDVDDDIDNSFNKSNINDRHLNVSTILDDLGLKQYKALFQTQEVQLSLLVWTVKVYRKHLFFQIDLIAFFLLTDDDLKKLGITDQTHREMFKNAIKTFCGI